MGPLHSAHFARPLITAQGITSSKTIARMVHGINRERLGFETPYLRICAEHSSHAVCPHGTIAAPCTCGVRGQWHRRRRTQNTGACPYNRTCAPQYVGKSQSCMVISGRLIVHAPVFMKLASSLLPFIISSPLFARVSNAVCFHSWIHWFMGIHVGELHGHL